MAVVTETSLTSGSIADVNTVDTASIAPSANSLILIGIINTQFASVFYPTVTGLGLTWTLIGEQVYDTASNSTISLWRGMSSSTPTPGVVTISFGGIQNVVAWSITQYNNVDTSGTNGSGAVVQSVMAQAQTGQPTATLAAFGSTNNATYGFIGGDYDGITEGTGFTRLDFVSVGTPSFFAALSQWRNDNSTTVDATNISSTHYWGVIALEIKAQSTFVPDATISATKLTAGQTAIDAASATTASISPAAYNLILVAVTNTQFSGVNYPTITGCGLTWTLVKQQVYDATGNHTMSLYRAMGAAPTPGTLLIDFAGVNQNSIEWSVVSFAGVDVGGTNGSQAIVQSAMTNITAGTSITAPMVPFQYGSDSSFGFAANSPYNGGAISAMTGYTQLDNIVGTPLYNSMMDEWYYGNDIPITATQATSGAMGIIGIELLAAFPADGSLVIEFDNPVLRKNRSFAYSGWIGQVIQDNSGFNALSIKLVAISINTAHDQIRTGKNAKSSIASSSSMKNGLGLIRHAISSSLSKIARKAFRAVKATSINAATLNKVKGKVVTAVSTILRVLSKNKPKTITATPSHAAFATRMLLKKFLAQTTKSVNFVKFLSMGRKASSVTAGKALWKILKFCKSIQTSASTIGQVKSRLMLAVSVNLAKSLIKNYGKILISTQRSAAASIIRFLSKHIKGTSVSAGVIHKMAIKLLTAVSVSVLKYIKKINIIKRIQVAGQRSISYSKSGGVRLSHAVETTAASVRKIIAVRRSSIQTDATTLTKRAYQAMKAVSASATSLLRLLKLNKASLPVLSAKIAKAYSIKRLATNLALINIVKKATAIKKAVSTSVTTVVKAVPLVRAVKASSTSQGKVAKLLQVKRTATEMAAIKIIKFIKVNKISFSNHVHKIAKALTFKKAATSISSVNTSKAFLLHKQTTQTTAAKLGHNIAMLRAAVSTIFSKQSKALSIHAIKAIDVVLAKVINKIDVAKIAVATSTARLANTHAEILVAMSTGASIFTTRTNRIMKVVMAASASILSRSFNKLLSAKTAITSFITHVAPVYKLSAAFKRFKILKQRIRNIKIK